MCVVVWCGMQFDELLKKQSVTLEESSRICRGAPASGDSPIDGYWSCLCDKPLLRNTGRHTVTIRADMYGFTKASGFTRSGHHCTYAVHVPLGSYHASVPFVPRTVAPQVTFRILSKENEGRSGGWAVVGMASPTSSKGSGPGGADDSVGVGSDGTSSVGPCLPYA